MTIRVVIADDHHLVRQGIRALLTSASNIEVIGEAANGQEVVELVEKVKPDVVVMDIAMPRMDGTQAAERILSQGTPTQIVILSMHSDSILAQQLLRQGVKGYLLKASIADELPLAIRAASQGQVYLSPAISDSVLTTLMMPQTGEIPESPADLLSPREREVLQLVAEGYTNNAIAEALTISVKTVEKHRANLMAKLDVHDLPSLIRQAIKHNLIFLDK
ncbi:MAG: response regulator transcription factor [Chloroflexi bacterium]|nr:response regulator transcription factor [Chloroflexota bacterium]MCI0647110.1 response regulator transcription factor [Chloroflexota bacterium]MCI0726240.1 response regulator transcription factor [Chloroflexota bacterium]